MSAIRLSKRVDPPICMPRSCSTIPCCRCARRRLVEQGLRSAADLARFPLIHYDFATSMHAPPVWADWFAARGPAGRRRPTRGLRVNAADHALEAAVAGAGVALSHKLIASDDVHAGRLVTPFGPELPLRSAYYFVCPQGARDAPQGARLPRLAVRRDGGDEGEVGGDDENGLRIKP